MVLPSAVYALKVFIWPSWSGLDASEGKSKPHMWTNSECQFIFQFQFQFQFQSIEGLLNKPLMFGLLNDRIHTASAVSSERSETLQPAQHRSYSEWSVKSVLWITKTLAKQNSFWQSNRVSTYESTSTGYASISDTAINVVRQKGAPK